MWTALFKEGNITTSGVKLFRNSDEKTISKVRASSAGNRTIDNGVYIGRGGTISAGQEGDGLYQEIIILGQLLFINQPRGHRNEH